MCDKRRSFGSNAQQLFQTQYFPKRGKQAVKQRENFNLFDIKPTGRPVLGPLTRF